MWPSVLHRARSCSSWQTPLPRRRSSASLRKAMPSALNCPLALSQPTSGKSFTKLVRSTNLVREKRFRMKAIRLLSALFVATAVSAIAQSNSYYPLRLDDKQATYLTGAKGDGVADD